MGKIHAENLAHRIPGAELTALSDVRPDELARVAAELDVTRTFSDYRQVLELPDVDAVVVCTPTDTHYQVVWDAAAAGKQIFCEKPVDLTLVRVQRINEHVEKSGVQLMVGFNRRFDSNFLQLHETVKAGRIGTPELLRITSRDPAPPPEEFLRSSGGLFLDLTIHDFDMARYLMGSEVVQVYAQATVLVDPVFEKVGDWDTAMVTLTFQNGALGTIDNSRRAVYGYDQRAEVFGSAGMVAAANNTPDNHVLFDRQGGHSSLPLNYFMQRYTEAYLREMRAFVEALRQRQPAPVTGTDGLLAVAIALAAGKSVREKRPVPLAEVYEPTLATK